MRVLKSCLFPVLTVWLAAAGCQKAVDDRFSGQPDSIHSPLPDERFPGRKFRDAFAGLAAQYEARVKDHPTDARAYAEMSEVYATLWCFGFWPRNDALPKARAAAETAVSIDAKLGLAHTALGLVNLLDWDWRGAERELLLAIQLGPREPRSHHWFSLYLSAMGRHQEALAASTRAGELDPSAPGLKVGKGAILYFAHRFKELKQHMLSTVALDPTLPWPHDWLGMAYVELKDFENAIPTYEKAVELSNRTAEVLAGLGHAYGLAGRKPEALQVLEELEGYAKQWYVPPVQRAYVCLGVGQTDRAFQLLEEAFAMRAWELVFMRVEPWFDAFRSDPRFVDLEKRMNFPASPEAKLQETHSARLEMGQPVPEGEVTHWPGRSRKIGCQPATSFS
ncbi:MAG: tetratricopeptide repeat protein [Acidobacteriota bacterium]